MLENIISKTISVYGDASYHHPPQGEEMSMSLSGKYFKGLCCNWTSPQYKNVVKNYFYTLKYLCKYFI